MSRSQFSAESHSHDAEHAEARLSMLDRREFSRLMAASLALAGATTSGCRYWPEQHVVPQITREHHRPPGKAVWFASMFEFRGAANGVLAKSLDGRPIKLDGNPQHPCSRGGTDIWMQASVLDLYDPTRSRNAIRRDFSNANATAGTEATQTVDQKSVDAWLRSTLGTFESNRGKGLYVLTTPHSSLSLERLERQTRIRFPEMSWHVFDSFDRDNEYLAARRAFGTPLRMDYDLSQFDTVVLFDADLLGTHPAHLKWSHDWSKSRDPDSASYPHWVVLEPSWSTTGAAADERIGVTLDQIDRIVFALVDRFTGTRRIDLSAFEQEIADRLFDRLRQGTRPLLVGGERLSPDTLAAVHWLNRAINPDGTGIRYFEEPLARTETSVASLRRLTEAIDRGQVETLLILGGNPVFDAPADFEFAERLSALAQRGKTVVHWSYHDDETSQACSWHVPAAHELECWGDGRGWDGTFTVQQPLIRPLFDGWSRLELSLLLAGVSGDAMSYVRETAESHLGIRGTKAWRSLLHDGFAADSAMKEVKPEMRLEVQSLTPPTAESSRIVASFQLDRKVLDGRYGNNAWLQELPDPITKLTWGNAALISPADASQHQLVDGDIVRLDMDSSATIEIPVVVVPGQASGCIAIPLGYGRTSGHIARDVGVDVRFARRSDQRFQTTVAGLKKIGKRRRLPMTQEPYTTDAVARWGLQTRVGEARQPGTLVRETTWETYRRDPEVIHRPVHVPEAAPMFDQPHEFNTPHAWGMSIDLNRCIGCSACVVACQAENNIPVVGPANVLQNREMHWLRIDRYFKGSDGADAECVHVPVACAHCEDAPCEQVCPVAATVHDTEGLNAMVYNRCVGTRYCANNCPYKVRRFNYFDYHASDPRAPARPWLDWPDKQTAAEISELRQLGFNPDVTVRMRGVMEKCTFCVQRISAARIQARIEFQQGQRETPLVHEGEVVTACQQACPTQAIQFGDLNDNDAGVTKQHQDRRAYAMLEELNIKPRTRYLARIRNITESDDRAHDSERSG